MIVNGIRGFLQFYRKWLFLLISFLVVFAFHFPSGLPFSVGQCLLIVGNSILLAFTAAGAQETIANGANPAGGTQQGREKYTWGQSWLSPIPQV
ncbi:MAG: hypothetical protein JO122_11585 [Acetobacteraceae bacterium]|nr:hypothetical protein [Acetobacteraceae bacterium]